MTHVDVKAAIDAGKKKLADLADITAEDIVREFARIAFFNVAEVFDAKGKLLPLHKLTEDQQRALSAVEAVRGSKGKPGMMKVRAHDKTVALTQLGRIRGMFVDRVEQVGHKPITLLMVDRTLSGAPPGLPLALEGEEKVGG